MTDSTEKTTVDIAWAKAFLHFQYDGEATPLADLLESNMPLSGMSRHWLAKVVKGEITRGSKRGKSNAKLTLQQIEEFRRRLFNVWLNTEFVLIFQEDLADDLASEVIDVKQRMEKIRRDALKNAAKKYGVTEGTIREHIQISETVELARGLAGRTHTLGSEIGIIGGDIFTAKNKIVEKTKALLSKSDLEFEGSIFE